MSDLDLFTTMTMDEAISAFQGWRKPKPYCRGQFVVAGKSILFFAALSGPSNNAKLLSPDSVEWWPEDPAEFPDEKVRWFPEAVQAKYDRRRKKWVRQIYLFLQEDEKWLYCGPAHQAYHQYAGAGRFDDKSHVGYHLRQRLPYDNWIALGGYPAWKAKIAGREMRFGNSDITAFEKALTTLPEGETHVELTRWNGDIFSVFLNESRGFPMYQSDPGDSGTYVLGGSEDASEMFSCPCCGIEMEFPRNLTVARDTALSLLRTYFVQGRAPEEREEWIPGLTWGTEW